MSAAKKGDAVVINYIIKTGDGRVVGGTEREGSQTLTLGEGKIFPELERGIIGMQPGEEKAVVVAADNAFGPRRDDMVMEISRSRLPENLSPQPGMQLGANAQDGSKMTLTITEVKKDSVIADANHPLAGEDLHFDVTLVDVKAA